MAIIKHIKYSVFVALTAFSFNAAEAQTNIPGQADPGRIQDRVEERDFLSRDNPQIAIPEFQEQVAPSGSDDIKLTLDNVVIEDQTKYDPEELRSVYAEYLNKQVSLTDIYTIANALTVKYRNDGFILTQVIVPPQTIESGTVTLRAVEGYVDRVTVDGDDLSAFPLIQSYVDDLVNQVPLDSAKLERGLLLINDLPGVTARSILSPSRENVGAANLRIIIERDPYEFFAGIDNFGTRFLGPLQLSGGVRVNQIAGLNNSLLFQFVGAPDDGLELGFGGLTYEHFVGSYGTKITANFSRTDTRPGFDLEALGIEGRSSDYGIAVSHPFIRSRNTNWNVRLGIDARDLRSESDIAETVEDRLRTVRLGTSFNFLDTTLGVAFNAFDIEFSQGLAALGATNNSDNRTRSAADASFSKLNIEFQRLQNIYRNVNLLVAGRGQYSNAPLLSSEEFGIGGLQFGRGFDPSEIIGDEGFAGKVELQWNTPYELGLFDNYQVFTFYDAGRVFNDDAVTSDEDRDTVTSFGVGLRGDITSEVSTDVILAFPLNRDVETQRDRDPRLLLGFSARF